MPWKQLTSEQLAKKLGVDIAEVREKQRLAGMIIAARKAQEMSQATLAEKLSVSQSRVAQIESGVGTGRITFDVLLKALGVLGYEFKVVVKKNA